MPLPSPKLGLLVLAALRLSACNDNVGCVFTTAGCDDDQGTISENEAVRPIDGEWIADVPPEVDDFFPSGAQNPGTTPVVLVFSESMQAESLEGAFELVPQDGMDAGRPVMGVAQALVSDGRVLVLLPSLADALDPGEYLVRLAEQAAPLDLTGQELDLDPEERRFSVASTPPTRPRLVMTYPADDADDQSETPEIVAVFDRPVLEQSVTPASFDVLVNGANPPGDDPPATALVVGTMKDTRAFLYRSLADDGLPAALGRSASVELRLSSAIMEMDGDMLMVMADPIRFVTLPFSPPRASLMSPPPPADAIGLTHLMDGEDELTVDVDLDGAQLDDTVDLFLLGVQKDTEPDPPLIALLPRSVRVSDPAHVTFTREDVDLLRSSAPDDARFNDGAVTFAFRLRRGAVSTPLRLLDLDPDPDTIQDPLLDTVAPEIEGLVGSTGTGTFRSDLRGLSLAGTASEDLRIVEVTTTSTGDNGMMPPVVGSTPIGITGPHLFLAAPVTFGVLEERTATYTAVGRDRAMNKSPEVSGTFTQLGALGSTAFSPGLDLEVEVFDSRTLAALPGALVLVHSDRGNGNFPLFSMGTTGPTGQVTLATEGASSVGAIVTVVLATHDLFTLHGVPSTRVSVPLRASGFLPAQASGAATTTDPVAEASLRDLDRRYDDSRRSVELPRGFEGSSCTGEDPLSCRYGPEPIADAKLGARSFYAGLFSEPDPAFRVKAFGLLVPLAPAARNTDQVANIEVPFLLEATTPVEERAQVIPDFQFLTDSMTGVDLDVDDVPSVTVETLVPGISGSIAVAQGLAMGPAGDWTVRAAFPGAITVAGSLGHAVEADPFVRVEVIDSQGNAAGARPRLPAIMDGGQFLALRVPTQTPPTSPVGQEFTLSFINAIEDSRGVPGLYRVELFELVGSVRGRGWTLWRFDPQGTDPVEIRVVDVRAAGAEGLADGNLISTVSAFAGSSLSTSDFFWSDVEREFELFSRAAPLTFQKL